MTIHIRHFSLSFLLLCCLTAVTAFAQPNSFTKNQLIDPLELANSLKANTANQLLILNMGVERNIKNAVEIGIVSSPSKYKKLQEELAKHKKDKQVVIYCGCCKLEDCPNVPLAYSKIRELGFNNVRILNMVTGLNEDWIDKGFPMAY